MRTRTKLIMYPLVMVASAFAGYVTSSSIDWSKETSREYMQMMEREMELKSKEMEEEFRNLSR